jgi:O-antigen/teichoic acid export membrane protein
MSTARRVFRHTAIQVTGRTIGTVLGLAAIGIMTRALGTEGFGRYTTVTAFLGIFAVLADFGISTTLVAMMSERGADENRLAKNALGLRIVLTAAVLAVAVLIGFLAPYSPDLKLGIAVMAISFIAIAANQIQIAIFQRHVRMDRPALTEILGRLVLLGGVGIAAIYDYGLYGMFAAVIVSNVIQAAVASLMLRGIAPSRPQFDLAVWKRIMLRSWPVGVSIAFNLIYLRADTLVLSLTRTQSEVGIYGAAYRVVDVLTVIPMLFMGLVLPFLARAWSDGDKTRFERTFVRASDALWLAAAPLAAGSLAVGPDLMAWVAGAPFRASGQALMALIFGVSAIFVGAVSAHAVVAIGAQKKMILPLAVNAGISLTLYLLFIPTYGMWAASGITVFSEIFAATSAYVVVKTSSGLRLRSPVPLRTVLASAVMALAIVQFGSLHVTARIGIGIVVYCVLILGTQTVDLATLKQLVSPRDEA